jgi:hypothetical protein
MLLRRCDNGRRSILPQEWGDCMDYYKLVFLLVLLLAVIVAVKK